MKKKLSVALLVQFVVCAAPITGLFNTGTDASNVALGGGNGTVDSHYQVIAGPGIGSPAQAVTYFNGAYLVEDSDSRWISSTGTGGPGAGNYTFRLQFDLTGLDPLTASLAMTVGMDNVGTILLNNAATGVNIAGFNSLTAVSLTSGFVAGVNTLDFVVTDQGPPMALRVDDLRGSANLQQGGVPEPSTIIFSGGALAALGLLRRKLVR